MNIYTHIKKIHDVQEDIFYVNNTYTYVESYKNVFP